MGKALLLKLKEALISVLPVAVIVLIISFTPLVDLNATETAAFAVCAVLLILGIGLFNLGADLAMTPMGEHVGSGLTKSKKILVLISVCFLMGVLITVAEPDLSVLAGQVEAVMNSTVLIVTVGVGVGIFLVLAVLKPFDAFDVLLHVAVRNVCDTHTGRQVQLFAPVFRFGRRDHRPHYRAVYNGSGRGHSHHHRRAKRKRKQLRSDCDVFDRPHDCGNGAFDDFKRGNAPRSSGRTCKLHHR